MLGRTSSLSPTLGWFCSFTSCNTTSFTQLQKICWSQPTLSALTHCSAGTGWCPSDGFCMPDNTIITDNQINSHKFRWSQPRFVARPALHADAAQLALEAMFTCAPDEAASLRNRTENKNKSQHDLSGIFWNQCKFPVDSAIWFFLPFHSLLTYPFSPLL